MSPQPSLHLLGLSHHTAPIEWRERLSFSTAETAHALTHHPFDELAILSTCNRLELYAVTTSPHLLRDFVAEQRHLCAHKLEPILYHQSEAEVVRHLSRVAAGLDSLVLGEPQILGQVNDSLETAETHQSAGHHLRDLFRTAVRAGKRARTETEISRHALGLSGVAVNLLVNQAADLANQHILLIGAGEMIQLALKQLHGRGVRHLTIANRRPERARVLAKNYGAHAYGLADLPHALATADVVLSATSAPSVVLDEATVAKAMNGRPNRPLTLIDLAVPRDIANTAALIPCVTLFDVDDLQSQVDSALLERQRAVPAVERIIQEELIRYMARQREAQVRPLITDLRQRAEAIRQQELARTLRHLALDELSPDMGAAVREQMEFLSQALIKKLLHEPTTRLRTTHTETHIAAMRYLFDLEEEKVLKKGTYSGGKPEWR